MSDILDFFLMLLCGMLLGITGLAALAIYELRQQQQRDEIGHDELYDGLLASLLRALPETQKDAS